jgi:hypothetical protein
MGEPIPAQLVTHLWDGGDRVVNLHKAMQAA